MSLRLWLALLAFAPGTVPTIDTFGTVRRLIEQRDDAPKVAVAEIVREPHAYALGSIANLRGEITIVDGTVWLSYPPESPGGATQAIEVATTPERAAFLVAAHVAPAEWQRIMLPEPVSSATFDDALERWASEHGLRGRPFPFRIDARFESLTLATIDQKHLARGPGPGSEKELERANVRERVNDVDGTLVGFYDPAGDGAFTHEGTHTHLHAVIPKKPASGHAESFSLAPGAILSLPLVPGS